MSDVLPYLFYSGAFTLGILHGSDPGHGWILAASFGTRRGRAKVILASSTIALGHFLSSIVIVVFIWIFKTAIIDLFEYIELIAGSLLIAVGLYGFYKELGSNDSDIGSISNLTELFKYSLILGFAHEEEIALASMILLGSNPLILATVYSLAVYIAISLWSFIVAETLSRGGMVGVKLAEMLSRSTPIILIAIGTYVIYELLS